MLPSNSVANLTIRACRRLAMWSTYRDGRIEQVHTQQRGIHLGRDPRSNHDLNFTLEERKQLGLYGLVPFAVQSQQIQMLKVIERINRAPNDMVRYDELMSLLDRNEHLFYRCLIEHTSLLMPIVYTPTVGQACQEYGLVYKRPKGMYFSINDDNSVEAIMNSLENWPSMDVKCVVVTDGERILGLGDQGAHGMPIPVGKLALYVALAGVRPEWCLPVVLDCGTENEEFLGDRFYVGLRQHRVRGEKYDQFVDNFMKAITQKYGKECLIQFEDFGNQNAFRLLDKYQNEYCTFNDDIQGTACVVVAGLFAAVRATKKPLKDNKFLLYGAGEASIGIAQLIQMALMEGGMSKEEAKKRIYLIDSKGLLVKSRTGLTTHKQEFVQDMPEIKDLTEIIKAVKPTALLGAAAQARAFTTEIIQLMGQLNERPIIFALSNPTSIAECTAADAYLHTQGRVVFASGSPFPPWLNEETRQTFYPGQGNNAYVFPGVALGVIRAKIKSVTNEQFLVAAQTLAAMVTEKHLAEGRVYPPLEDIREISLNIAVKIIEDAYKMGEARYQPEPKDKREFVKEAIYDASY